MMVYSINTNRARFYDLTPKSPKKTKMVTYIDIQLNFDKTVPAPFCHNLICGILQKYKLNFECMMS